MSDIVAELRSWANGDGRNGARMLRAASEIERLRAALIEVVTYVPRGPGHDTQDIIAWNALTGEKYGDDRTADSTNTGGCLKQ